MQKTEEFPLNPYSVGYIVMGKPLKGTAKSSSNSSTPDFPLEVPENCGCILPEGRVAGFYRVGQFADLALKQDFYFDAYQAEKLEQHSTFLLFNVPLHQAVALTRYWKNPPNFPRTYNSFTSNCTAICYDAFIKSGILEQKYTIANPQDLYDALLDRYYKCDNFSKCNANLVDKTGFFGNRKDFYNSKVIFIKNPALTIG